MTLLLHMFMILLPTMFFADAHVYCTCWAIVILAVVIWADVIWAVIHFWSISATAQKKSVLQVRQVFLIFEMCWAVVIFVTFFELSQFEQKTISQIVTLCCFAIDNGVQFYFPRMLQILCELHGVVLF